MKTEKITLIKLEAGEDKVLTDGKSYGKVVYLGVNDSADNWYEITDKEYQAIQAEEKQKQEKEQSNEVHS